MVLRMAVGCLDITVGEASLNSFSKIQATVVDRIYIKDTSSQIQFKPINTTTTGKSSRNDSSLTLQRLPRNFESKPIISESYWHVRDRSSLNVWHCCTGTQCIRGQKC